MFATIFALLTIEQIMHSVSARELARVALLTAGDKTTTHPD